MKTILAIFSLTIGCFAQTYTISFKVSDLVEAQVDEKNEFQFQAISNGTISYDLTGRLSKVGDASITYDLSGETSKIGDAAISRDLTGEINRIGTIAITYDLTGRLSRIGVIGIQYDLTGRLSKVGNCLISYDISGRISQISGTPGTGATIGYDAAAKMNSPIPRFYIANPNSLAVPQSEPAPEYFSYFPVQKDGKYSFEFIDDVSEIIIYDLYGNLIQRMPKGVKVWDGIDASGQEVNTGFYVSNVKLKNSNRLSSKFIKR